MGGIGSGRLPCSRRPKTSDTLCVGLHYLRRQGRLNHYQCRVLTWQRGRQLVAWAFLVIDRTAIDLEFALAPPGVDRRHLLPVMWTPCRKGGERPWLYCFDCGCNVIKLYLGPTGRFACRTCCGLVYASQYESAPSRAQSKADRILARLGLSAGSAFPFTRPKGMHHRTFERLLSDYAHWSISALDGLGKEINALDTRIHAGIEARQRRRAQQRSINR